jgi:hypothetical protein
VTSATPEDVRRQQAARQTDLHSWRANNPDAERLPSPEQVLEDQARNRSQVQPRFAAAWSLLAAGFAVLPCNQAGRPLAGAEPVPHTARLMETWDRHPNAVAAAACGPEHDLVAVSLSLDGAEWLTETSVDPATRRRPLATAPPPSNVPTGGYQEPDDPRPGHQHRDLAGTGIRLIEVMPEQPRITTAVSAPGARDRSMVQDLAAKVRRPKPAMTLWLGWAWPQAEDGRVWELPVGRRVRGGVELPRAVPADGVVLEVDGRRFRVSWGSGLGRRLPMPSWLVPELGGKLRAP